MKVRAPGKLMIAGEYAVLHGGLRADISVDLLGAHERRIVCGGARPTEPEACYYTADHYASFTRIAP